MQIERNRHAAPECVDGKAIHRCLSSYVKEAPGQDVPAHVAMPIAVPQDITGIPAREVD